MESNAEVQTIAVLGRSRSSAERRDDPDRVYQTVYRASTGDREALAELYATYAGQVFFCVQRILHDRYEAEDVTQQVFLKLMSVLPRYQRRDVPFASWLMRVARNAALDADRKRRPMRYEEIQEPDPDFEEHYQRGCWLREALEALPPAQRRVVILRHVVGLSAPEIAERLGKSPGSVHALDQRGRRTLQGDLIKLGWAPATANAADRDRVAVVA
jgi:RNA polymerase sigma-70 factor, ECF subfamily